MFSRTITCAVLVLGLGACSSAGPAFERLEHPPALAGQSVEVRLRDARERYDAQELDVPMMSVPGDGEERSPPLDPSLQAQLELTLRQHLVPGPRSLRVEVSVVEALASWSGNMMTESEKGTARVSVALWDAGASRLLASGTGESWAEKTSLDTNEGRLRRILSTAVQAAVLEFLAGAQVRAALAGP